MFSLRVGMLLLPLLVLALVLALSVPASAVTVEPGVDAMVTATPAAGEPEATLTRTLTLSNTNTDVQRTYSLGPTVAPVAGGVGVGVALSWTGTVPGARNDRVVTMPVPLDFTFVPGSLQIGGVTHPDPTITDTHAYVATVDLPASSTLIIRDQLIFRPQ